MTDAMEVLFSYAQERLEAPLLLTEPEYASAQCCAEKQAQRLRSMLSNEGKECLESLLGERSLLRMFENEAMFRAGFRLAMELSR